MGDNVNAWFGLSYASWLVIPRVFLQEMPEEWQRQFVKLLEEYQDTFADFPAPEGGVTVRLTDANGKLIPTPDWIYEYKHPHEIVKSYTRKKKLENV